MIDFSGKWLTTFGTMNLTQEGERVHGSYVFGSTECLLEGQVANGRLTFTYREPTVAGEGWFEPTRHGQAFVGQWRPLGDPRWGEWVGERVGFDGVWESDF